MARKSARSSIAPRAASLSPVGGVFRTRSYRPAAMLKSPPRKAVLALLSVSTREEVTAGGVDAATTGTVGDGATTAVGVGATTSAVGVGAIGRVGVAALGSVGVGVVGTAGLQPTNTTTRTPVR